MISSSVISVPTGDCLGRQPVLANPKLLVACARVRQHRSFCRRVVCCLLCVVCCVLFVVYYLLFVECCLLCVVCCLLFAVC